MTNNRLTRRTLQPGLFLLQILLRIGNAAVNCSRRWLTWPVPTVLFLIALMLGGCTTLLPQGETVRLFILTPAEVAGDHDTQWPFIRVRTVSASRFDTNRLLLVEDGRELLPYHGARWAESLPDLISGTWAVSLERSGINGVSHEEVSLRGRYPELVIHLRDFQASLVAPGRAICTVGVTVELATAADAEARYFQVVAEQAVDTTEADQVATGFDQAHAEVLRQALAWLRQQGG